MAEYLFDGSRRPVAAVRPGAVLVVAGDDAATTVGELWPTLSADATTAVIERLTAKGLGNTPDFALVTWTHHGAAGLVRVLVRGDFEVTVGGGIRISGVGVSTWTERVLDVPAEFAVEALGAEHRWRLAAAPRRHRDRRARGRARACDVIGSGRARRCRRSARAGDGLRRAADRAARGARADQHALPRRRRAPRRRWPRHPSRRSLLWAKRPSPTSSNRSPCRRSGFRRFRRPRAAHRARRAVMALRPTRAITTA